MVTDTSPPRLFAYTGEQTDLTGSLYLRARTYDTDAGRFLSVDTVQPNAPGTQGCNRYAYTANNLTTWTDLGGQNIQRSDEPRHRLRRPLVRQSRVVAVCAIRSLANGDRPERQEAQGWRAGRGTSGMSRPTRRCGRVAVYLRLAAADACRSTRRASMDTASTPSRSAIRTTRQPRPRPAPTRCCLRRGRRRDSARSRG